LILEVAQAERSFKMMLSSPGVMGLLIEILDEGVVSHLRFLEREEWNWQEELESGSYPITTIFHVPGWVMVVVSRALPKEAG